MSDTKSDGRLVWRVTVCIEFAVRFPQFRQRLASRLPTLNQVNRQQIELLRRFRAAGPEKPRDGGPVLLVNCIAAGFGTTGQGRPV